MLTRLRLFLHVLVHGCRFVRFSNLKCQGCKHLPICNLGRYDGGYGYRRGTASDAS